MGLTAEQRGQRKESGHVKTEQWKPPNLNSRKKTDRKEKSRSPKGPVDNRMAPVSLGSWKDRRKRARPRKLVKDIKLQIREAEQTLTRSIGRMPTRIHQSHAWKAKGKEKFLKASRGKRHLMNQGKPFELWCISHQKPQEPKEVAHFSSSVRKELST